jgi:hypothetical protein
MSVNDSDILQYIITIIFILTGGIYIIWSLRDEEEFFRDGKGVKK